MTKRKVNIRPDLVGELFIDGNENIYRLLRCGTEPLAYMQRIGGIEGGNEIEKPISQFANLVQLKPIRPIEKPKKLRADLGKHHKKAISPFPSQGKGAKEDEPEIADKKGDNLTDLISSFSVTIGQDNKPHTLKMGEVAVGCLTLKEGAMDLLRTLGIDQKSIKDAMASDGKDVLLSILERREDSV